MTNKYRMRIDQKEIYNARDLPQERGFFPGKRGTDSSIVLLVSQTIWEFISLDGAFFPLDREAVQLCVLSSYSIIHNLRTNRCPIKAQLLNLLSTNSL